MTSSHITFKTSMIKSSLCDYSDAYIFARGTISVEDTSTEGEAANGTDQMVIFKNCSI